MLRDDFTDKNYQLVALPGRVIVEYEKPVEKTSGGILLPDRSKREAHVARVVDVGDAIDEYERVFTKLVKAGMLVKANPAYGTKHQWTEPDGTEREIRIFKMYEISAICIPMEDK